jgi:tetratricopeptide (TPR) repeat protein
MKKILLSRKRLVMVLFVLFLTLDASALTKGLKAKGLSSQHTKYRRRVAICVGIDKYSEFKAEGKHCSDLKSAVGDAKKMAALFRRCGFDEVILLTNQQASKDGIIRAMERVKAASQKDDLLVFSYSGHGGGVMVGNSPRSYLIPFDCLSGQAVKSGISVDLLKELALTMNNRHVLFLLDCCYAGVLVADRSRKPDSMNVEEFKKFLKQRCIYALVASGVTETAIENVRDGGVFTNNVIKALNGKADTNNDGKILVIKELTYVVTRALSENSQIAQTPRGAKLALGDGDIVLPVAGKKEILKQASKPVAKNTSPAEIKKTYQDVLKSQEGGEIRQAQLLMTKVYIDYDELSTEQKKSADQSKYLSKLVDLTKQTFEQISKSDSDESALLYYYSQKYLESNPDRFKKASAYFNMGAYCNYRGEYEKAELLIKKALTLFSNGENEKHAAACQKEIVTCLRFLGLISISRYKYNAALQYLGRAAELVKKQRKSFDPLEMAKLHGAAGQVYIAIGKFKTAKKWLERSLSEYRKNFKEESFGAAAVYNDLGVCALENKDFHRALGYFKHAIDIDEKIFGPNSKHSITSYCNLGAAYLFKKDFKKALKYARQARLIVRRYFSSKHPRIRDVDLLLGQIYLANKRYSSAEYFFKHNLSITKRCFGNHPQTAIAYKWLGQLYLRKHFWRRAESLFKKARNIQDEYLGSSHYQTINTELLLKQMQKEKEEEEGGGSKKEVKEEEVKKETPKEPVKENVKKEEKEGKKEN